ncbi:GNAT family N-acetyltransferase [Providencia sp. Je.9.19]|uniref:GNAT family N-acetyltransferase n=1 Tax=unclassified Providencia TaxID=2633465 RepID=UPI003DAA195A
MTIQFERLSQISSEKIIALNTHPLVLKHMPLGDTLFDDEYCCGWIAGKEQHWQQYGYGVWAIVIDGDFAGWGGLQNEADDADLALVLHPTFWGYGPLIIKKMIQNAFDTLGILSVTIHLPLSRNKLAPILSYGFVEEALVDFDGIPFKRYRLTNR